MNNPKLYENVGKILSDGVETILKKYLSSFNGSERKILDIGSGPGSFTYKSIYLNIKDKIDEMIGIDQSHNMVMHSNKYYANDKLSFKQLNIEANDIPVEFLEQFDYVFSFWALHFVKDYEKAFSNILKMMRSGGGALLVFPAQCVLYVVYNTVWSKPCWAKFIPKEHLMNVPYQNCDRPEIMLKQFLKTVGLKPEVCEVRSFRFTIPIALIKSMSNHFMIFSIYSCFRFANRIHSSV
ncbi:hypothetical protein RI129_004042 [Pyrocoelia pectoralis]|uniref:Methyltransferase type 11 domain-containing protein n=1 Tax=Pyrocoelia pectoralis TaxID=417401 RepID=A0AAN7VHW2_9COLE